MCTKTDGRGPLGNTAGSFPYSNQYALKNILNRLTNEFQIYERMVQESSF
jgi:hypothetical protein